jgi:hypothetical protein
MAGWTAIVSIQEFRDFKRKKSSDKTSYVGLEDATSERLALATSYPPPVYPPTYPQQRY